jgi:hypothetical protein
MVDLAALLLLVPQPALYGDADDVLAVLSPLLGIEVVV